MQLLYGRDKTDYKVLSKSRELNGNAETILIDNYLGYDFVKNKSDYSDIFKEPFSISYCTTNLDGCLNNEMILVSKNGRSANYTTPSRYAHARLFDIEDNSFKEDFFDIFKYSFVDSKDSEKYKDDDIDSYIGNMMELEKTDPLSNIALKSILYLLFDNFRSISNTVYLIIDVEGDNYNKRSIDVIRQIYEYIPYFMRKIIGFTSYGTLNQKYSNRIKLVAMTRENSEIDNELKVDLLNLDLQKIEKITTKQSKLVVDYILGIDEFKRKELFEFLDSENKKSILNIKNLFNICLSRKLWKDSSSFEKMSSWIYNVVNPNELEEELFYEMMDIIESNLNSEIFNNYLVHILSKESNICESYLSKDKDLYNLLLFEDILSVDYKDDYNIKIDIDINYIVNWWNEKILPMLQQESKETDFSKVLKKEIEKYKTLDLQGNNYLRLKDSMTENINKLLSDEEKKIEKFVEEEKQNLKTKFENIESINSLEGLENEIKDLKVIYDKNKEDLKIEYGDKFKEIANDASISFDELDKFVEKYQEYLPDDSLYYVQGLKNDQLNEFRHQVDKIKNLSELENLFKSNMNDEKEFIILDKFEALIKSFDINHINDEKNIYFGKKICEKVKYAKYRLSDPVISILVDRYLNLDLNNLEKTFEIISQKIDFIKKNKNYLSFNIDNYNLNIKIDDINKDCTIKFIYLKDLVEYLKSKQNKSKFSMLKLINRNIHQGKKEFSKENKDLLNLIDKHLKK